MSYVKRFKDLLTKLEAQSDVVVLGFRTFPGLSKEKLDKLAKELGVPLGAAMRKFYGETNGLQLRWISRAHFNFDKRKHFRNDKKIDWDYAMRDEGAIDGSIMIRPLQEWIRKDWRDTVYHGFMVELDPMDFAGRKYEVLDFYKRIKPFDVFSQYYNMAVFPDQHARKPWILVSDDYFASYESSRRTDFASYLEVLLHEYGAVDSRNKRFGEFYGHKKPPLQVTQTSLRAKPVSIADVLTRRKRDYAGGPAEHYGVRIEKIDGNEVRLSLFRTCAETRLFPDPANKTFFLDLLADSRFQNELSPLEAEWGVKHMANRAWLKEKAEDVLGDIELVKLTNYPVRLKMHNYYWRDLDLNERSKLPRAEYRLQVKDARWIDHWTPGLNWGTLTNPAPPPRTGTLSMKKFEALQKRRRKDSNLSPADKALLLEFLYNADDEIAWQAAEELVFMEKQAAFAIGPDFYALAQEEHIDLRGYVLETLGNTRDEEAVTTLTLMLGADPEFDQYGINEAARALGLIGVNKPMAVSTLKRLQKTRAMTARSSVLFALYRLTGDAKYRRALFACFGTDGNGNYVTARHLLELPKADQLEAIPFLEPAILEDGEALNELYDWLAALGKNGAPLVPALEKVRATHKSGKWSAALGKLIKKLET